MEADSRIEVRVQGPLTLRSTKLFARAKDNVGFGQTNIGCLHLYEGSVHATVRHASVRYGLDAVIADSCGDDGRGFQSGSRRLI